MTDDPTILGALPSVLARCQLDTETGCWRWTGACTTWGYPVDHINGRYRRLHRFMLEARGIDLTGKVVHHRCRVHDCLAPAHLQAMSQGDHVRLHRQLARDHQPASDSAGGERNRSGCSFGEPQPERFVHSPDESLARG